MSRAFERTENGEQTLIDGVQPVTLGEELTARTNHPMRPKRNPTAPQKSCDIGLFDEVSRAQLDLCDFIADMEKTHDESKTKTQSTKAIGAKCEILTRCRHANQ